MIIPERLKSIAVPFVIFMFSFILRLSLMSAGPYHVDCLSIALNAQKTLETHQLVPDVGFGHPVVVALGALFIGVFELFGNTDPVVAINFLSVLLGSVAVVMLYLLIKRLFDERAAVFGALLFSTSPIFLATSVYGMNHAPAICFLLAGLYCLLGYFKEGRISDFIWAGFWLGMMGGSRFQDIVLMMPAIGVLFLLTGNFVLRKKVLNFFVFLVLLGFVIILLHSPYLADAVWPAYAAQLQNYWNAHGSVVNNFNGIFSPYLKYCFLNLILNFSWAGLLIAVVGFLWIWNGKKTTAVFLAVWFLIPFLILANDVMVVPRFFIILIPAVVIAQACALAYYSRWGTLGRWGALIVLVVLVIVQVLPISRGLLMRHRHAVVVEYARWVGQVTPERSKIIAGDEGTFIAHYAKRSGFARPYCVIGCSEETLRSFSNLLDDWIAQGGEVYMTDIALYADDPKEEFHRFITSNYDLYNVGQCLMEDWHHDCFELRVWYSKLYRLKIKEGRLRS